jgi:hypothetical protein
MTNQKHFKAIHRETKEEIEFGLEDIVASKDIKHNLWVSIFVGKAYPIDIIYDKDYELFYWHGGWHAYEQ